MVQVGTVVTELVMAMVKVMLMGMVRTAGLLVVLIVSLRAEAVMVMISLPVIMAVTIIMAIATTRVT